VRGVVGVEKYATESLSPYNQRLVSICFDSYPVSK